MNKGTSKKQKNAGKGKYKDFIDGTHKGKWQRNGEDAVALLKNLHDPNIALSVETTGPELCASYKSLETKWGTRRLRDNWRKIVDNYLKWQNDDNRKYHDSLLLFASFLSILTSADYFSELTLIEAGLLDPNEEPAFPGDGDGEEDDDENVEKEDSPERANTGGKKKKKKKGEPAKKPPADEAEDLEDLFEDLDIDVEDNEEMKIRMIAHDVRVAPYDEATFYMAKKLTIIAELPSGVSPQSVGARQDPEHNNNISVTIERSKNLFNPSFIFESMLKTGKENIDTGAMAAAMQHVKEEEEKGQFETSKPRFMRQTYQYVIPPEYNVDGGFRTFLDPTVVNNKRFIEFVQSDIEDDNGNINTANYIYFSVLAWTDEQIAERNSKQNLMGKPQVSRRSKKFVFSPSGADKYGDYATETPPKKKSKDSPDSGSGSKKRRAVSPVDTSGGKEGGF
jgi:hypothetical protein